MAICLTCGEQSENHIGMEMNGSGLAEEGFTNLELSSIHSKLNDLNIPNNLINLNDYLSEEENEGCEEASILLIKGGVNSLFKHYNYDKTSQDMLEEQLDLEWDKTFWDIRRKKVLNKRARYNLCYGVEEQTPDMENKKGTIIAYKNIPITNKWKECLSIIFGEKARDLEMEGNYYYNIKKCGIGFHGDGERKKVIAASLGETRPIHWQWYHHSKPIGERIKFTLDCGDMYIMSEKATGNDWKKRSIKTLRHAAGVAYTK
jgi:hypothetical protein